MFTITKEEIITDEEASIRLSRVQSYVPSRS